jgi:hypothetical protein
MDDGFEPDKDNIENIFEIRRGDSDTSPNSLFKTSSDIGLFVDIKAMIPEDSEEVDHYNNVNYWKVNSNVDEDILKDL